MAKAATHAQQTPEEIKEAEIYRAAQDRICGKVLAEIASPTIAEKLRLTATRIKGASWRVNAYTKTEMGSDLPVISSRIVASHFVVETEDGMVADPPFKTINNEVVTPKTAMAL